MALVLNGSVCALVYALCAALGLIFALIIGYRLHFNDIVQTHCKVPEFWPSISATTGDFIEGRWIWRTAILIAFPFRFSASYLLYKLYGNLVGGQISAHRDDESMTVSLPSLMFIFDIIRMSTAEMWTLIASSEALIPHEAAFVVYMLSGFLLQVTQVILAGRVQNQIPNGKRSYKLKSVCLVGQTVCACLVVKFFLDHYATCQPGVYSRSTMCEWGFAFFNIAFDATQVLDLAQEQVTVGTPDKDRDGKVASRNPIPNWAMYLVDIFFAYNYFSVIIQLFQHVYFLPMVAMEYTIDAVFILAPAASLVLLYEPLRRVASGLIWGYPAYIVMYGISVPFTYFSFDATHNASWRIALVGLGTVSLQLAMYTRFFVTKHSLDVSPADITRIGLALPLGLICNMCGRILFVSLDPLHSHAMYNLLLGIVVGGTCTLLMAKRAAHALKGAKEEAETRLADSETEAPSKYAPLPGWALGGALGSIVALSLVMLTNPGVLPRYIGVDPYPANVYIVLVFFGGVLSSSKVTINHRNPIVGVALLFVGFALFHSSTTQSNRMFEKRNSPTYPTSYDTPIEQVTIDNWYAEEMGGSPIAALFGALIMVFATGALWPMTVEHTILYQRLFRQSRNSRPVLPSFDVSFMASLIVPLLMHVYVVCFPFVPLGPLFRDRVYIPYVLSFAVLGVGLVKVCKFNAHFGPSFQNRAKIGKLPGAVGVAMLTLLVACVAGRIIGAPGSDSVAHISAGPTDVELSLARRIATAKIAGLEYTPSSDEEPMMETVKPIASINAIIWTVHFGQDDFGGESTYRMIDLIKEQNPGIIGILESDAARPMNGNRDFIEHIGYSLGFDYVDYGPTTFDSTFGCALITKFPITYIRRYVTPSPVGELACLIHARVNINGVITNVYVGHNGNTQHTPDRRLQSQFLGKLAIENPGPSIFLGYLTTAVDKDNYHWFANPASDHVGGLFRDTAYTMYREREWERIDTDGYVGPVDPEDEKLVPLEQQYKRPPPGEKIREFHYPKLRRNSTAHPRFEYLDRYCQYMLYKTGNPLDEKNPQAPSQTAYELKLLNWHRVLDVRDLSDTEIQLGQFLFDKLGKKE